MGFMVLLVPDTAIRILEWFTGVAVAGSKS